MTPHIVVLDVGKSLSKLTLWTPDGVMVDRRTRANVRASNNSPIELDALGIEAWLTETLTAFSARAHIGAIVPVGHGAAAAVVRDGVLVAARDYESPAPEAERALYDAGRDPFVETGSPALPNGLNLGVQLHMLEAEDARALRDATILTWPQYWAWLLSGTAATEVTSLGCHSDLWRPMRSQPSSLAVRRGWAGRLAPLRAAAEVLGTILPDWAARTGVPPDAKVHCGLHDSNAALLAARAFPEIAGKESTVLSTGTWFVAMRTPGPGAVTDLAALPEKRDCLVNVDAYNRAVPSARFMGGREIETLSGIDTRRIDIAPAQPDLLAAVPAVLRAGAMVLPGFAPGVGPFPDAHGRWIAEPKDEFERRAAVSLYAALMADVSLSLIGARERLLIEGRFADAQVFVQALARLRPDMEVYVANAHNDVSFGALRLLNPQLRPQSELVRIKPLEADLMPYRDVWSATAAHGVSRP